MSEAHSHASGSIQASLCPDDSISQIIPQYFTDNTGYCYDMDIDDNHSAPCQILISVSSDLLTPTIDSNSTLSRRIACSQNHQFRDTPLVPSFPSDLSGAHLTVPSSVLS